MNGPCRGAFREWLEHFEGEPRIAWYPSAGSDFRDLLYLNAGFATHVPASLPEPSPPDIFLHTDYFPWSESSFLNSRQVHLDARTQVSIDTIEELPRCDLALDTKIVSCPEGSTATGRAVFMTTIVTSDVLGTFSVPVVYVFSENAAFCAERVLPNQGCFSHVVHVRYGGGCGGGGKSTGIWLLNILEAVGCEVLVTDGQYSLQSGDQRVLDRYPELAGDGSAPPMRQTHVLKSAKWSGHGDVSWNLLKNVEK